MNGIAILIAYLLRNLFTLSLSRRKYHNVQNHHQASDILALLCAQMLEWRLTRFIFAVANEFLSFPIVKQTVQHNFHSNEQQIWDICASFAPRPQFSPNDHNRLWRKHIFSFLSLTLSHSIWFLFLKLPKGHGRMRERVREWTFQLNHNRLEWNIIIAFYIFVSLLCRAYHMTFNKSLGQFRITNVPYAPRKRWSCYFHRHSLADPHISNRCKHFSFSSFWQIHDNHNNNRMPKENLFLCLPFEYKFIQLLRLGGTRGAKMLLKLRVEIIISCQFRVVSCMCLCINDSICHLRHRIREREKEKRFSLVGIFHLKRQPI